MSGRKWEYNMNKFKNIWSLFIIVFILFSIDSIASEPELTLPSYRIEIEQQYLDELNKNPWTNEYFPAVFMFSKLQGST
jgi:hypothetical protein